jgi:hypothetical protein
MDDLLYIYFTVTIIAQAENIFSALDNMPKRSKNKKLLKEKVKEKVKETQIRKILFESITGDVFMTLENISKETKWWSILEKIATEEWYQTCKKWRFVFGIKNLEPEDVLEPDDGLIRITCIKIAEPLIIFETPDGEFLVSVPFDSCKIWLSNHVYLISACNKAFEKLLDMGKDDDGTYKSNAFSLPLSFSHGYIFCNKNGEELHESDVLEVPKDDNLIVVAIPRSQYCPLCIKENTN